MAYRYFQTGSDINIKLLSIGTQSVIREATLTIAEALSSIECQIRLVFCESITLCRITNSRTLYIIINIYIYCLYKK